LGRGFTLRDQTHLGLRRKNTQIHQTITPKIQTLRPPQATTLSLFPLPSTIRGKGTDSNSSQHFPKIITQQHQGDTTIIGSILYYAQTVDITVLIALSSIAIEQPKGTSNTME
jgi:hypothetical protein